MGQRRGCSDGRRMRERRRERGEEREREELGDTSVGFEGKEVVMSQGIQGSLKS